MCIYKWEARYSIASPTAAASARINFASHFYKLYDGHQNVSKSGEMRNRKRKRESRTQQKQPNFNAFSSSTVYSIITILTYVNSKHNIGTGKAADAEE